MLVILLADLCMLHLLAPCAAQSLQSLVGEVQAKTAALLEAEQRFAELEALMQRMVSRAGAGFAGLH